MSEARRTTTTTVEVTVNGKRRRAEVDTRKLLVEAIREDLALTGTHVGCMTGDCGACTVQLDGEIVKSCLLLAVQAQGCQLVTIEGLAQDGALSAVQRSFWDGHGFQCGFCLPGPLFAAQDLLARNPTPTRDEIREALAGNLCRCTGYQAMVEAVASARGSHSTAQAQQGGEDHVR